MENRKINNKGFSLVEILIVIVIMTIIAGVLAPSLVKYIASTRRSTDVNNAGTIATAVSLAMSNEDAYSDLLAKAENNNQSIVTFTLDSANDCISSSDSIGSDFDAKMKENISGGIKSMYVRSKKDGANHTITATDFTVTVDTSNHEVKVSIGRIECYPDSSAME